MYRAGRFEEAIQHLKEADELMQQHPRESLPISPAYTWFFLAMAHHCLRHNEEALNWLDEAVQWTDKAIKEYETNPCFPRSWNRSLTLKLLRDEAESLLRRPTGTATDRAVPMERGSNEHASAGAGDNSEGTVQKKPTPQGNNHQVNTHAPTHAKGCEVRPDRIAFGAVYQGATVEAK